MHIRMSIGINYPRGVAVQTSRKLCDSGWSSIRICRIDIKTGIIVTVGMFIKDHEAIRWSGVVQGRQFFCIVEGWPVPAVGGSKPLIPVAHRSIHGAGADAVRPARLAT